MDQAPPSQQTQQSEGQGGPAAVQSGEPGTRILENSMMDNISVGAVGEPWEIMESECGVSEELSDKVFENNLLLKKILEYVIYPNGKVSRSNLKNIRLVRKSWLGTIVDSMRKFREPVFRFLLGDDATKLGEFVRIMASPVRLTDFIPPFSLILMPTFFREENHQHFSDCLTSCGDGLVAIDLTLPRNCSMTFVFPSFHLPLLQLLAVQFSRHRLLSADQSNGYAVYLLQAILNATSQLKRLPFRFIPSKDLIPPGFQLLALPKTITTLQFDDPVKDSDLQLLIKNDLPLHRLSLYATDIPYSRETVLRILEKFRTTLRSVELRGRLYGGPVAVENYTSFKFPLMGKLQRLILESEYWELRQLSRLEARLPKMSFLRLWSVRESMFTKWTENSKFEAVKSLIVWLVNHNALIAGHVEAPAPMTITLEKMRSLNLAYPNVVNLDIKLCGPQSCGLKYLFMEMQSLEKLILRVEAAEGDRFHRSHWDSVLIGMPLDMVTSFRRNPDYLDHMDLKNSNFPSIRKLTALKSFALTDRNIDSVFDDEEEDILISDMVFQLAFLGMPNLENLFLHGNFHPSGRMTKRWMQEKGTEILRSYKLLSMFPFKF